jgi:hypothetical protein
MSVEESEAIIRRAVEEVWNVLSVLEKSAALTYHIPNLAEEGKRCAKAKLMIPLN